MTFGAPINTWRIHIYADPLEWTAMKTFNGLRFHAAKKQLAIKKCLDNAGKFLC